MKIMVFINPEILYSKYESLIPIQRLITGFPGGSVVKNPPTFRSHRRCRFNPWVRKIPSRRKWQPTPVFLPGEFHGQRSLADYSPWGRKESDMTE